MKRQNKFARQSEPCFFVFGSHRGKFFSIQCKETGSGGANHTIPYFSLYNARTGIGAQGGDLPAACSAALDSEGMGLIIPISRGISKAADPAAAAKNYRDMINTARGVPRVSNKAGGATLEIKPFQREFIEFALLEKVLRFGSFQLKSGRQSPYFFNAGLFDSGRALSNLGRFYAEAIHRSGIEFDVLFGPAYKGISLGAVVSLALYERYGLDVGFAYNRKEKKDHGEGGSLVGAEMSGKRVLVIDDVITAGTAIRESMTLLFAIEAKPVGVVIALDRQEKGKDSDKSAVQQVQEEFGFPVVSVAGLTQIAAYLESRQGGTDGDDAALASIRAYRDEYGVS